MRNKCTKEYLDAIEKEVDEYGFREAAKRRNIQPESIRRSYRLATARNKTGVQVEKQDSLIKKILARYTPEELRIISTGGMLNTTVFDKPEYNFEGDDVTLGFFTDSHIGEVSFKDELWIAFIEECEKQGVQRILCAGDVHEGMSNRTDQVYHLTNLGVSAQMEHAEQLFNMTDIPITTIDGNHDRWGIKINGLFMVRDLSARMNHVDFIGCDFGDLMINGTKWMLFHGEDGSSYATSYRVQKLIESFTGGDKPQVLLCGHTHKMIYLFERNIHAVSGGALSYQSAWMKSTKKACHTGFWIIKATIRDSQIVRFCPTWYPIYK